MSDDSKTTCPDCKRKMQVSTLKPGKVYCSWCRKYADKP